MTSQRQSRIAEIVGAARARDAATREAFLRDACGDDHELRLAVEAALDPAPSDVAHIEGLLAAAGRASHYQQVSRVGSGGMGVVYKALDTRLNRAVALKVIRPDRDLDTGRLRKEARAAASLDHPYICKVYELIETGAEPLIVMEFVEGETLTQRLRRDTLPVPATVQLGIEIAEGLATAHERGLVHRDLKPGNVMVTSHGHIKLLDFGLARLDATSTGGADTQTAHPSTDARAGTPFYMAPEQAEGRPVTARADVFALGVVLFQCVTGRLPFEGARHDYIHHLLTDAPTPVRSRAPDTPAALAVLIDRCLDKTPAHRPESAREVVQELHRVAAALSPTTQTAAPVRRRRPGWSTMAAAAAALGVLGVMGWRVARSRVVEAPDWQSRPFVTSSSADAKSRISPDRRWISYLSTLGGDTQLLVKRVDGADAQRVALPAGTVMDQVWSPDGSQLACLLRQGTDVALQVVPAFFGGTPVTRVPVSPAPTTARLLRWIDRGVYAEITHGQERSLVRLDLDSGAAVNVAQKWAIGGTLRGFDVSPDGRRVVFTQSAGGQEELWLANLDGSSAQRLTTNTFFERYPLWSGLGTTIFFQSNRGGQIDLWQLALESGTSTPLTQSQAIEQPESASPDGTLLTYVQVAEDADLWIWNPSTGAGRQLTDDALSDFGPSVASSGSTVAFQRMRPTPMGLAPSDFTVFAGSLGDSRFLSPPRPLDDGYAPRLSPDGAWVAYLQRGQQPGATLFVKHLQTNETMPLSSAGPRPVYSTFPLDWAEQNIVWNRAGTELYFVDGADRSTLRRYRTGAKEADPPLATAAPKNVLRDLYPSPDGRTVAYVAFGANVSTVHWLDVLTGADRTVAEIEGPAYIRGWLANNAGVVLIRSTGAHEDLSADVEVLVVSPTGTRRAAGRIDHAFLTTARFDPDRGVLYVTRSDAGVHNLSAFSLASGTLRRVTDNTLPGVTFSGVDALGTRGLIGVRTERKSDIWLLDAAAASPAGPSQPAR